MIRGFVQDSFVIEILKRQCEEILAYTDARTSVAGKTFRLGKDVRSQLTKEAV